MFDLKSRVLGVGDDGSRQRIRFGTGIEFARSVYEPTQKVNPVVGLTARFFFVLMTVTVATLILSAVGGWVWVGLVALVVAMAVDALAVVGRNRDAEFLHKLRADSPLRCMIYLIMFVGLLGREGYSWAVAPLLALAVGSYGTSVLFNLAARWLARRQGPLLYVPQAEQNALLMSFARIYNRSLVQPVVPFVAQLLGIVAGTILLVDGHRTQGWLAVIGAWLVGLICAVVNFVSAVRLGSESAVEKHTAKVLAFLDELAPTHVTYMSAGAGQSQYILNQWVPVIEQIPSPGFIIVRESSNLGPIKKTTLPVVHAPKTRHVEELTTNRVQVAYYLANAGKNVHLLREAAMKHVFLNHGDSDKSTSANPVSRVYDEVWVAGQAAIDRYVAAGIHIPEAHYRIVGRPQMAALQVGPVNNEHKTLLYAPTFEGYYEESNYSSLERMGPQMIRYILENYPDVRVIFKPHPNTGAQRPGMVTARIEIAEMLSGGFHQFIDPKSSITLYDAFDMSDVMISDISSVVTDYLYTERPVIVSNPSRIPSATFFGLFPTQLSSYLLDGDLSNLGVILDDALGEDSMREQRIEQKKYVLGDLPEGPMRAFAREAERVTRDAVAHAATIENRFRISADLMDIDIDEDDDTDE